MRDSGSDNSSEVKHDVDQRGAGLRPRVRALALTSAAWQAAQDECGVLRTAASLLAEALHGGCVIRVLSSRAQLVPLAVAHVDPPAREWLDDLLLFEPEAFSDAFSERVLQSGEAVFMTSLSPRLMRLWTPPAFWPFVAGHSPSGLMSVPLPNASRVGGTLSVWREPPGSAFNDDERVFVEDVARRLPLRVWRSGVCREQRQRDVRRVASIVKDRVDRNFSA